MHYKRVAEHETTETYEQTKAKEEAINTAAFTQGEYATLCRGNTSQVMAFTFVCLPQATQIYVSKNTFLTTNSLN